MSCAVTDEREPIRVGVLGARGRMGIEVCQAVDAADDLELVAMVDQGDWLSNAVRRRRRGARRLHHTPTS